MFDAENEIFECERLRLCERHLDEWVLVKAPDVLEIYDNYDRAFTVGLERYGTGGHFMIKQILVEDVVHTFTPAWLRGG